MFKQYEAKSIGGRFGIIAELPTIQDIVEWREGHRKFTRGYYRLVDGPDLDQLQQKLAQHFDVKHAIGFCSFQAALLELLELLQSRLEFAQVKVVTNPSNSNFKILKGSLESLNRPIVYTSESHPESLEPLKKGNSEILLIGVECPKVWQKTHRSWLNSIMESDLPVVACSSFLNTLEVLPKWTDYWVSSIQGELQGGIVLSNLDRQMMELFEKRKKRGNILSLRHASVLLDNFKKTQNGYKSLLKGTEKKNEPLKMDQKKIDRKLSDRLCKLEKAEKVYFYPSGMSAITSVLSMLRTPEKPKVIVLGLLYTDSYAFLEMPFHGKTETALFLQVDEIDMLEQFIDKQTACIFTETITNPLLNTPDLEFLRHVASSQKIPLVIDNTLATPLNCRPLDWGADFVIHSTSKYLSGCNNHGGGVVLTQGKKWQQKMVRYQHQWGLDLVKWEKEILAYNLEDFEERMYRFNSNGNHIAQFLKHHPSVYSVNYPSLTEDSKSSKKWLLGYGGIVSFILKSDDFKSMSRFYDNLPPQILKAPSLGSNKTLVCPYALLAHYHESQSFFTNHQISKYMIRIAAGCETNVKPILTALNEGLNNI